ncbi:MAG: DUF2182 domain-containing protein, partial [Roseovarius gahaiensis]
MTGLHWLVLFGLIIVAWGLLYAMALPQDLRAAGRLYGADFLASLCVVTPDAAGFVRITAMWALMSAAMMAPTALPALATYDELPTAGQGRFGALLAGYLGVWLGFSVLYLAISNGSKHGTYDTSKGEAEGIDLERTAEVAETIGRYGA